MPRPDWSPMDIVELILHQHAEQRRAFATLDDIARHDTDRLRAVWSRLEVLLEVHAKAEELFFYPRLLAVGAGDGDGPDDEVKDAISDHNEIRDGIREASGHPVGSDDWWAAVGKTRKANSEHMGEEECDDLPDFCRHADLQTRHEIALAFLAYEDEHAAGITPQNEDPGRYVARAT